MSQEAIREFIEITGTMFLESSDQPNLQPAVEEEPVVSLEAEREIYDELYKLIFKLRAYQDPDIGDYSAGVEAGMSRAADMLDNLINRVLGA